jgi:hypothetical protein
MLVNIFIESRELAESARQQGVAILSRDAGHPTVGRQLTKNFAARETKSSEDSPKHSFRGFPQHTLHVARNGLLSAREMPRRRILSSNVVRLMSN